MRWLASIALLLALNAQPAAAIDLASVNIVDAPRTQDKWGYAPATRRVQPGTWVTWSNNGQEEHTVTALDGSFDSSNLEPSEGFSWFFDQPGTFTYECALHPWMVGKIIVGDGVAPVPDAVPPVDEIPPADDGGSAGSA
jgi:plastocyanin